MPGDTPRPSRRPGSAGLIAGLLPSAVAAAESTGSPAGLIAGLLPPAVAAAESVGSPAGAAPGLFPAEAEAVRTAGPRRRAEFAAGRSCARAALATLGVAAGPILPGPAGQPLWPAGVTGSITHCAGYQACAAARTADVAAIGIDAEPDAPLPAGLIERIATAPERAWISRHVAVPALPSAGHSSAGHPSAGHASAARAPATPPPAAAPSPARVFQAPPPAVPGGVSWDRLLFSAKEAACKLWYPLTGQWPGFREVTIGLATTGTLTACLPGPGPAGGNRRTTQLTGRWLVTDGLIVTAIWAPG